MASISHRERVLAALDHEETDRVPLDFGGSAATTIYYTAYERLKAHLGIEGAPTTVTAKRTRTVIPDEEVLLRFDVDTRFLSLGGYEGGIGHEIDEDRFVDEWGTTWEKRDTHPYMSVDGPFCDRPAEIADLEDHDWPDPENEGYYRGLAERARSLHANTDYAIVLGLPSGVIHQGQWLRGWAQWLMDLYKNPDYACRMMDIVADHWIGVAGNVLDKVGNNVDVVYLGDDLASQQGTLFSPEVYRKLIKPRHARMIGSVKERGVKVMFHTCGAASTLFEDLIEVGVDAVNPVQVNAKDMDPARLKRDFGDRLTFWGGVDTQKILPFGTPADVRAEVRRMIDIMTPGGGYILNSVHNIQPDVPPENVVAMLEEAGDYVPQR